MFVNGFSFVVTKFPGVTQMIAHYLPNVNRDNIPHAMLDAASIY